MLSSPMIIEIAWAIMAKSGLKSNKQRNCEEKCIWMPNFGQKLTCVKFSGAFDGIIENT